MRINSEITFADKELRYSTKRPFAGGVYKDIAILQPFLIDSLWSVSSREAQIDRLIPDALLVDNNLRTTFVILRSNTFRYQRTQRIKSCVCPAIGHFPVPRFEIHEPRVCANCIK